MVADWEPGSAYLVTLVEDTGRGLIGGDKPRGMGTMRRMPERIVYIEQQPRHIKSPSAE